MTTALPPRLLLLAWLTLVLVAGTAPLAHAEEPPTLTVLEVDDTGFPSLRVIFSLIDASGRPVQDVGVAAVAAVESGAPARVERVDTVLDQQIGLAVILTMDVSGSMAGAPLTQAKAAATSFVDNLQPTDHAAVVSFGSNVTVQDGLTGDRSSSRAALARLQAAGNTALYSAVQSSVELARTTSLPRRAIVLLSDGQDFGGVSRISREDSLRLVAQARIPIYAVGLGAGIDRAYLQELARSSGGAFLEAPDPASIAGAYSQLSRVLRSQYAATVVSSAPSERQERDLLLRVTTSASVAQAQVVFQSRRAPQPPTPPPVADAPARTAPAEPSAGGGGGSVLMPVAAAVVGIPALAAALWLWSSRRKASAQALESMQARAYSAGVVPRRRPAAAAVAATSALDLSVIAGPDTGLRCTVTARPVMVGSGPKVDLRLSDAGGAVSGEHARIWWRSRNLVYHRLSPGGAGGRHEPWVILEPGDVIDIGPHRLRVEPVLEENEGADTPAPGGGGGPRPGGPARPGS